MYQQKYDPRKSIMRNFKNNYRRNRYKNHSDRNHHKNGNGSKIINDLQNGSDFVRKSPGRNNHNASKLIEKYSSLAREALSNGDKILSENYLQHADHFTRILNEREIYKKEKSIQEKSEHDLDSTKRSLDSNITEKNLDDDISKEIITESPAKVV